MRPSVLVFNFKPELSTTHVLVLSHFKSQSGPIWHLIGSGFDAPTSPASSEQLTAYDFVVIRIARLCPLHILTAAFVAVSWTAWFLLLHHGPPNVSKPTASGVLETITLTQSLFTAGWSLNTPSWSIAAELWCGLIILPLCSCSRMLRSVAVVVCVLAYIATALKGGFIESHTWRYGTALGCFAVGWGLHFFSVEPVEGMIHKQKGNWRRFAKRSAPWVGLMDRQYK
jgi:peptidoglycan/LPS O-acetylase OafA/YrhL